MRRGEHVPDGATAVWSVVGAASTVTEDAWVDEGRDVELGSVTLPLHANTTLLICQAAVVEEKPDHTMPETALPLAPAKVLKGMVMV
jgi:hypothetical protein